MYIRLNQTTARAGPIFVSKAEYGDYGLHAYILNDTDNQLKYLGRPANTAKAWSVKYMAQLDSKWHWLLYNIDRTQKSARLYVDGVLVNSSEPEVGPELDLTRTYSGYFDADDKHRQLVADMTCLMVLNRAVDVQVCLCTNKHYLARVI